MTTSEATTGPSTVTLAVTGASGFPYGWRLLECLLHSGIRVNLLVSRAAREVARLESDYRLPDDDGLAAFVCDHFNVGSERLRVFGREEWTAPVASGSGPAVPMVVCPCSTSTLSAIATGASNTLIERAADVAIKERRPLVLVPREAPLSPVHLEHMLTLSRLGVRIVPAAPGFYHRPQTVADLIDFIVARVLNQLGVPQTLVPGWGVH